MLTYTKIATVTVGAGGAATISFSNIPQTFTDLVVMFSGRAATGSTVSMGCSFNGDIAANYSSKELSGSGSSVSSFSPSYSPNNGVSGADVSMSTDTANTFANSMLYISGYSSSTKYKSTSLDSVTENNGTTAYAILSAGIWNSTAPITSMSFLIYNSYSFAQYSSATLYGIGYQPKATGGTISSDGTYWYHAFTSTGLFAPSKNLQCDVLVVAGGGGGGNAGGGGGGGGGFRTTSLSIPSGTIAMATVGAGGIGGAANSYANGTSGTNSSFYTITSIGGGYGGGTYQEGASGGSGGGAGMLCGTNAAGTGTSGQGSNGGKGYTTNRAAGGGGGASAVGADGTNSSAGNGGNGTTSILSGSSVAYAGGGGGGSDNNGYSASAGSGGTGGGGAGIRGNGSVGVNGTANLGGGGGGSGNTSGNGTVPAGGNGGSGVVIIRYKI